MKNISLSTAAALALFALAAFIVWGALGGWSGTMMDLSGGMDTGFGGIMTFVGVLAFPIFFATLIIWVRRNWRKKK